jgi:hypothetical protein
MARRRHVVRLGIPALIVAGLAVVALWRVSAPIDYRSVIGTNGTASSMRDVPLTRVADLVVEHAAGRQARLEDVGIGQVTSPRTFWIGKDDDSAFVVLDPDVKRDPDVRIVPGGRVTLIGLVRPAPDAADSMRQWQIDAATADALVSRGTYLHATEIRASARLP